MTDNKKGLLYQRWDTSVQAGDFSQARRYYSKMIADQLQIPTVHYLMGLWYRQYEQLDQAITAFQLALEQHYAPVSMVYFEIANTYQELQQDAEAEKYYMKAISNQPDFIDAIFCLGQLLANNNREDEAAKRFYQVLAIGCEELEVYTNVAVELSYLQRKDEAIDVYFKALILEPDNYYLYSNLGTELAECGDYSDAIFCHEKAIGYNSFISDLWYNLACTYSLMEVSEKGIFALERAIDLDPTNRDYAAVDDELDFLRQNPRYWKVILG